MTLWKLFLQSLPSDKSILEFISPGVRGRHNWSPKNTNYTAIN